jgi:hypothetical protein
VAQNSIFSAPTQSIVISEKQITTTKIPLQIVADPSVVRSVQNRQKIVVNPTTAPTAPIRTTTEPQTEEELENQAKSAYYKFGTSVHDTINDHEHVRQEVREGLGKFETYFNQNLIYQQFFYHSISIDRHVLLF